MPNQNEYLAKKSLLDTKQDALTAGANISINNNNVIAVQGLPKDVKVNGSSVVDIDGNANIDLTGKQDTLTAGNNITIQNNIISANIEANPQDTPTADLDSIDIDGTVYNIAGSGGTSVIPNPVGTPTEILETVSIEGTIYDIPGNGGSGSYSVTTLWSGPNSATMELSESFRHFDAIMFTAKAVYNSNNYELTTIWSKQDLQAHINDGVRFCASANDSWYIYFTISNNTTFVRQDNYYLYISEIKGIKYGGNEESAYQDTVLYTDTTGTTGTINNIVLSKSLDNFDAIYCEFFIPNETTYLGSAVSYLAPIIKTPNDDYDITWFTTYGNRWFEIKTTDGINATLKTSSWNDGYYPSIYKIHGVKYQTKGSDSEAYTETNLYTNATTSQPSTIVLSEAVTNFDAIVFESINTEDVQSYRVDSYFLTNQMDIGQYYTLLRWASNNEYINFQLTTSNTLTTIGSNRMYVKCITGIKYGAGGGGTDVEANPSSSPTETLNTIGIDGVVYDIPGSGGGGGASASGLQRTLLWDYVNDNNSVIPYDVYSVTLHDDINNYDAIILELVSYAGDLNGSWRATNIQTILFVDELNNNLEPNAINLCTFSQRSTRFYIHDNIVSTTINNEDSTNGLVKVYGLRFNIGGISDNYEVNDIGVGDGTNSRTFTFPKTPKKVTLQGYTSGDGGWYESTYFIWGENFMTLYGHQGTSATGGYVGQAGITYGADGRSFTINAASSFGAFNRADNFTGKILAEYSGGTVNDISGMTWSLLDSTTSTSTAVAIPTDAQYIVCMAEMTGGTEAIEVAKICLAEVNKLLLTTNKTSWVKAYEWHDFSGNHTTAGVKITNGTIQCTSGYSGCTTSIYAVS